MSAVRLFISSALTISFGLACRGYPFDVGPLFQKVSVLGLGFTFNPFSPACATFLAELCNPVTRQAIALENCSNPLRIQGVLWLKSKINFSF